MPRGTTTPGAVMPSQAPDPLSTSRWLAMSPSTSLGTGEGGANSPELGLRESNGGGEGI